MEPVIDDHPQVEQLVEVSVIGDDGLMDFFDAPAVEFVALQRFEYKEVAGGGLDPVYIGLIPDGSYGFGFLQKIFDDAHVDIEGGTRSEVDHLARTFVLQKIAQLPECIPLFVGQEDATLIAVEGQVEDGELLADTFMFPFGKKEFQFFLGGAVVIDVVAIPAVVHQVEDGQHGRFVLHIVVVP